MQKNAKWNKKNENLSMYSRRFPTKERNPVKLELHIHLASCSCLLSCFHWATLSGHKSWPENYKQSKNVSSVPRANSCLIVTLSLSHRQNCFSSLLSHMGREPQCDLQLSGTVKEPEVLIGDGEMMVRQNTGEDTSWADQGLKSTMHH